MFWLSALLFIPLSAALAPGTLRPISPSAIHGLVPRSDVDFSTLDPATKAQLLYGSPGPAGQILLANMTLFAPSGLPIVMMENFEGLTSAVDCNGDDGQLSVTFADNAGFQEALRRWSFIQEDVNKEFLIITNHDGCGPDEERAAYRVSDVDNDEVDRIVTLKASKVAWKEVTGSMVVEWGQSTLPAPPVRRVRSIRGRSIWDKIKNGVTDGFDAVKEGTENLIEDVQGGTDKAVEEVKDVAVDVGNGVKDVAEDVGDGVKDVAEDVVEGAKNLADTDVSKEFEFDLAAGKEGEKKNIFADPRTPPVIVMDCANCFTTGKFKVAGRLVVDDFKVKELTVDGSFAGFRATVEVDTTLTKPFSPAEINKLISTTKSSQLIGAGNVENPEVIEADTEIIEVPAGPGVVIPGIFSLGLIAAVDAGFSLSFKGVLGFTVGVACEIPDTAKVHLDFVNMDASSATGFEAATLDPKFEVNNASVTVTGSLFFRPKISAKIEVDAVGELSADIKVNLPSIDATATAEFNEKGVCPDDTSKTGLKFSLKGVMSLVVGINAEVLGTGGRLVDKILATTTLFELPKCFPLHIPFFDSIGQTPPPAESSAPEVQPQPSEVAAIRHRRTVGRRRHLGSLKLGKL